MRIYFSNHHKREACDIVIYGHLVIAIHDKANESNHYHTEVLAMMALF